MLAGVAPFVNAKGSCSGSPGVVVEAPDRSTEAPTLAARTTFTALSWTPERRAEVVGGGAAPRSREAVQSGQGERERGVRDEPRREHHRAHHPRDDHAPVLERLAQALDRVAAELRELVEEQHPVVAEGAPMYLENPLRLQVVPNDANHDLSQR
jgi:hypothetical protein